MSIIEKIKDRINAMDAGSIMTTSDFADLSSVTTIRKSLGRCVEEGMIRRVFDGVYEKPKYSRLLGNTCPQIPKRSRMHWLEPIIGQ